MAIRFINVSNPAALGVQWRDEGDEDDTQIQLAVSRPGGTQVLFAMQIANNPWTPTSLVVEPERFGPIPTNQREMLAYAKRFAGVKS